MTTTDRDPFLDGGSSLPGLKFEAVGAAHTFQIVDMRQVDDRGLDGVVRKWDNGDTRKVWVADVDTTSSGGPADASLWLRGNLYTAVREAIKTAGLAHAKGAVVKVTHHEVGKPKAPGYNGAKLFTAVAKAGPALKAAADDLDPFA